MRDASLPLIEICVESADGAGRAAEAGADRVELCSGLAEGGVTPSIGAIERAAQQCGETQVFVIVRPRGGDFVYSDAELDVMVRDIAAAKKAGANGIVSGALRPDGRVDLERTRALVEASRPQPFTFHRAFDMCDAPGRALDELVDLGVDRVLTSGQAANVIEGAALIRELIEQAAGRIIVLPGGGVREHNVEQLLRETGAQEIHFRATEREPSAMEYRNPNCRMGSGEPPGEFEIERTSAERIANLIAAIRSA